MKVFLIHGFGTGVSHPYFGALNEDDGGFKAFKDDIKNGEAYFFSWEERYNFTSVQYLNPFSWTKIYRKDRIKVEQNQVIERLGKEVDQVQPEIILCHSMGCRLLMNYLKEGQLPASVKKVVFVQGDFDNNLKIENNNCIERLKEGTLTWENYYCWWDYMLISSYFVNKYIPIGISQIKNQYIKNVFYVARPDVWVHENTIRDAKFRLKVLGK